MSATAILMVTWFLSGAEVNSQQVQFDGMAACEAAKGQVLADADRLAKAEGQTWAEDVPGVGRVVHVGKKAPTVSAVCVGKGGGEKAAASKGGGPDAAEMDRCVASFIKTYLAIGRGEPIPAKDNTFKRIILDQEGRGLVDIPAEFLARDTCAPGKRYGWATEASFPPSPPNPYDPQQMAQWREACLRTAPGIACFREQNRLLKMTQTHTADGFPLPPVDVHSNQEMDEWNEECLKVKSGSECWRERGRLSKLPW